MDTFSHFIEYRMVEKVKRNGNVEKKDQLSFWTIAFFVVPMYSSWQDQKKLSVSVHKWEARGTCILDPTFSLYTILSFPLGFFLIMLTMKIILYSEIGYIRGST